MIYHITEQHLIKTYKNDGYFECDSLKKEGFIHCSLKNQLLPVANHLFKGKHNLVIVCIDENKLNTKIIFEDLYNDGECFPHIYGKINSEAIDKIINFFPEKDGTYKLPNELT